MSEPTYIVESKSEGLFRVFRVLDGQCLVTKKSMRQAKKFIKDREILSRAMGAHRQERKKP